MTDPVGNGEADAPESYLEDLQRLKAEFENFKKRTAREREATRTILKADLLQQLLPVLDSLESAVAVVGSPPELTEGMGRLQDQLLEILDRFGLERIQALGEPFDPEIHEAVLVRPGAEQEPDHVVGELAAGYRIDGRVLRPSRVEVSQSDSK